MPLATKLLFILIGLGLMTFLALAFMHGATSKPTPARIEPIGRRRYDRLWIVDKDLDNPTER